MMLRESPFGCLYKESKSCWLTDKLNTEALASSSSLLKHSIFKTGDGKDERNIRDIQAKEQEENHKEQQQETFIGEQ